MPITEKAKHTAGPWADTGEIDRSRDGQYTTTIENDNQTLVAIVYGRNEKSECEANARMMAASPELLQALEYVQETIKTARKYFPKSVCNSDRFQLENTCATVGSAIRKAKEGL